MEMESPLKGKRIYKKKVCERRRDDMLLYLCMIVYNIPYKNIWQKQLKKHEKQ